MSKILDNVDLGKAFDKFLEQIKKAQTIMHNEPRPSDWAYAAGYLESATNEFFVTCTGESIYTPNQPPENKNDLKDVNI